jgi:hypothetical protein
MICFSYVSSTPVTDMISTTTPTATPMARCSQKIRVRKPLIREW